MIPNHALGKQYNKGLIVLSAVCGCLLVFLNHCSRIITLLKLFGHHRHRSFQRFNWPRYYSTMIRSRKSSWCACSILRNSTSSSPRSLDQKCLWLRFLLADSFALRAVRFLPWLLECLLQVHHKIWELALLAQQAIGKGLEAVQLLVDGVTCWCAAFLKT